MRELQGINIRDDINTHWINHKFPVTNLTLEESSSDRISVKYLLKNIDSLEHFKFSFGGLSADWRPRDIVRYLTQYAAHSLISLDLTGDDHAYRMCWNSGGKTCIETLKHFQCLKTIRMSSDMLVGYGMEKTCLDDSGRGMVGEQTRGRSTNFRFLKDISQFSVESLALRLRFREGTASQILEGLAKRKEEFPRLTEITFEDRNDLDSATERECEEAGIAIRYLRRTIRADRANE